MKEKNPFAQELGRLGGKASAQKRWGDKTPEQIKEAMRAMRRCRKDTPTPASALPDTNGAPVMSDTNGAGENQA
jgi:hypothetical protein